MFFSWNVLDCGEDPDTQSSVRHDLLSCREMVGLGPSRAEQGEKFAPKLCTEPEFANGVSAHISWDRRKTYNTSLTQNVALFSSYLINIFWDLVQFFPLFPKSS